MNFAVVPRKFSPAVRGQMEADSVRTGFRKESDSRRRLVVATSRQQAEAPTSRVRPAPVSRSEPLPRDEKATSALPCGVPCRPNCGGSPSYSREYRTAGAARRAFRVIRMAGKNMPVLSAMPSCRHQHLHLLAAHRAGYRSGSAPRWPACAPILEVCVASTSPLYCQSEI